jgi:hypothetical protein
VVVVKGLRVACVVIFLGDGAQASISIRSWEGAGMEGWGELCFEGHRLNAGFGYLHRCWRWRRLQSRGRNVPGPLRGEDDKEALRRQRVDGDGVVGIGECRIGMTGSLDGASQKTPEHEVVDRGQHWLLCHLPSGR